MQSSLSPSGPAATEIAALSWVLFVGGAAILLLVIAATCRALATKPRPAWLSTPAFVAVAGIGFPVIVLSGLLLYVYGVGERLHAASAPALRIEITGEQWWWRVRYLDAAGRPEFETANEIRVPAGKAVELRLRSADVIHSLWVPALAGKVDMIPGRENRLLFTATTEGTYRGQCAEFCGGPHALMALHVVALSERAFEVWRDAQLEPAKSQHPIFSARCAACHAVRGTGASGTRGPDLTHVGSRLYIAAGTLSNTPGNMAGWLVDSQHAKPGSLMPAMRLGAAELEAVLAYVATLQ
ncbi:MAG: cytochrome c oxidase subunit II [Betaproteobacteria bacterium]